MTAALLYASQAAAFFGGAALVLLVLALVLGSMSTEAPGAVVTRFTAAPGRVLATLTWEVEGAQVVLLQRTGDPAAVEVPAKGSQTVERGEWTLTAVSPSGARVSRTLHALLSKPSATHRVTLGAAVVLSVLGLASGCSGRVQQLRQPVIHRFEPDMMRITPTQGTVLRWTVENAAQLTLEPGGDVTGTEFKAIHPEASQTYILTARSLDGLVARARADVEVTPVFAAGKEGGVP